MLIENRNYLRLYNRELLNDLTQHVLNEDHILVEQTKKNTPTLKIKHGETFKYIHSKYDPQNEARRLVDHFTIEEGTNHIIIFGIGLGYHLDELINKYRKVNFSIYEPNKDVLATFLSEYDLSNLTNQKLHTIFYQSLQIDEQINNISMRSNGNFQIFSLPIYEKLYQEELQKFYDSVVSFFKNEKNKIVTSFSFQKRWTINAIKNFPTIVKTPNILKDVDRSQFEGKSAILVAAGPSLNEEFENLRKIKEKRLAYIFSVGSAINSLIEQGIYPDATCTYDPQERNQMVIQKVKDKNIANIPLIFGSTVGYETLADYNGPLLHMFTSQDTVAPFLLKDVDDFKVVYDAPSIAVVTYQLLTNLGFENIYLVGQNLSYQNNRRYAKGIEYDNEISTEKKLLSIKDVNNDDIWTDDGYNRMRLQLEAYIKATSNVNVYNTTKKGAKITGAPFIPLQEVIDKHFVHDQQVNHRWYETDPRYEIDKMKKNLLLLKSEKSTFEHQLGELNSFIGKLSKNSANVKNSQYIEKEFAKFDKKFKKLKSNKYYLSFLLPMLRVQIENLVKKTKKIKFETRIDVKVNYFLVTFGVFLQQLTQQYKELDSYFNELIEKIVQEKG